MHNGNCLPLRPSLKELLRTCILPSSLLLRIENIVFIDSQEDAKYTGSNDNTLNETLAKSIHRYATKLFLTDGELTIQALLHRKLVGLPDAADIEVGDYIDLRSFQVKKARRTIGIGTIIFLSIDDCHFLKQNLPHIHKEKTEDTEQTNCRKRSADDKVERPLLTSNEQMTTETISSKLHTTPPSKKPRLSSPVINFHPRDACLVQGEVDLGQELRDETAGGFLRESPSKQQLVAATRCAEINPDLVNTNISKFDEEGDDDFFEIMKVDDHSLTLRRQALHELDNNLTPQRNPGVDDVTDAGEDAYPAVHQISRHSEASSNCDKTPVDEQRAHEFPEKQTERTIKEANQATSNHPILALANSKTYAETSPSIPTASFATLDPPFHTLQSLRHPPVDQPLPSKNYTLNTLAFTTWVGSSLIHRPGSSFPPKRSVMIEDPSLYKQPATVSQSRSLPTNGIDVETPILKQQDQFRGAINLAVYADAPKFKPTPGTLVLLRGVVMQKLHSGDIILNAYTKLKEQRFIQHHTATAAAAPPQHSPTEQSRSLEKEVSSVGEWFIDDLDKIKRLGYEKQVEEYMVWWKSRHPIATS